MTSTDQLVAELRILGITLEAHGDRLRYWPKSKVTPDLLARLKAHKAKLLASLRSDTEAVWQATLRQLEGDPLFDVSLLKALRGAHVRWG